MELNKKQFVIGDNFVAKALDNPDAIMAIEGYANTKDLDRVGDIVEPSAWSAGMTNYMKFPVILLNHNWDMAPVGKVTEYKIDERGLWIRAEIAPTAKGYEVKTLIEFGVLKSFSVGFNIKEYKMSSNPDDPFIITEAELLEISVVNVPANMEALFNEAKSLEIELKHLLDSGSRPEAPNISKGKTMELKDIQEQIDPVVKKADELEVQLNDISAEIKNLKNIENQLKDVKENGTHTKAEIEAMIDKMSKDYENAHGELSKKVKELASKRGGFFGSDGSYDLKSLVGKTEAELKGLFGSSNGKYEQVKQFQNMNDNVLFIDALMEASSKNNDGSYHRTPKAERIKSLRVGKELNEFAKAMDTATSNEGNEWVPTDFSGTLEDMVRLELKLAPLFNEISMPTKSYTLPVHITDTIATLHGETTAVISAFDSTEQTPGTDNVTLTAKKARSRIQASAELTEDSIIPILPYITANASRGIARAIDRAILSGDNSTGGTATFDSGYTVATTDFRHAWDGLRYHWYTTLSSHGQDISTFSEDNLRNIRGEMGIYGIYPSDLAYIVSAKTYLKKFLKDLDSVLTLDKYGANAVVLSGELAKFDNIPIILSEFAQDDLNASGIYDGTTTTRSQITLVNRNAWLRGVRRALNVAVEKDLINDVYTVAAFKRCDFKPLYTPTATTGVIVNTGYNVTF